MDVPEVDLAFADILDLFNPLQHIPIVSSIYRAITGDEISGPAKVMGGALFGGPLGFVAGMVDAISSQAAGGDLGEMTFAAMFGGEDQGQATALAMADPIGAQPTPSLVAAFAPMPAVQAEPAAYAAVPRTPVSPAPVTPASINSAQIRSTPEIPAGGQPLTGDAALQALAADLRGPGVSSLAAVRPPDSTMSPRVGTAGTEARFMAPPPANDFAAQMLAGLDKYKSLAAERAQEQAASTRRLDQAL